MKFRWRKPKFHSGMCIVCDVNEDPKVEEKEEKIVAFYFQSIAELATVLILCYKDLIKLIV